MEEKLTKININIAGRSYPLMVNSQEKAIAMDIEKQVNTYIQEFQMTYPKVDMVDCLNMSIIKLAFDKAAVQDEDVNVSRACTIQQMLISAEG